MGRHSCETMARLTIRVPRGNQAYWDIMRELREFTISDIANRCSAAVARATIGGYIRSLTRGGYLDAIDTKDTAMLYRLVIDQPNAPRVRRDGSAAGEPGLGQDRMWRSMKMLHDFDAPELAAASSLDDVTVKLESAKDYIANLYRAGYLAVVSDAKPGHRPGTGIQARYRLRPDRKTGPLAPQVQRTQWVWDPNLKRVMGQEGSVS